MDNLLIGNKLFELRKSSGLSQDELAYKLEVSRQAVSKWERGEALPDAENLIKLSQLYQVSLDEIVGNNIPTANVSNNATYNKIIEDVDDEDDEDDAEDEMPERKEMSLTAKLLLNMPFPTLVLIAFFICGFVVKDWGLAWTLFITIPIYYSLVDAILRKKVGSFAYPILITFIYVLLGIYTNLWHPYWLLYLTVPLYDIIADTIDKNIKK